MRHALLVALTLALAPVAADGFRAWPSAPPAPAVQPEPATLAEAGGVPLGTEPRPPYRLEPYGPGYAIVPGGVSAVSTTAIGFEPFK